MRNVVTVALLVCLLSASLIPFGTDAAEGLSGHAANDDIEVTYQEPLAYLELAKKPSATISLTVFSTQHIQSIETLPAERSLRVSLEPLKEQTYTFLITDSSSGRTIAQIDVPIGKTLLAKLEYSANGGTGAMNPTFAEPGTDVKLASCDFTAPEGKEFKSWMVGSVEYEPGASFKLMTDITASAVWQDLPEPSGGNDMPIFAIGGIVVAVLVAALIGVLVLRMSR